MRVNMSKMTKQDLPRIVMDALRHSKGEASIVKVAEYIWERHQENLRGSGNLFFTWQYDMRWAATKLRKEGRVVAADVSPRVWQLKS